MKLIVYALLIAVLGLSVTVGYQFKQINDSKQTAIRETCLHITALDNTLISLIRQSEKATKSFKYYKEHPDELAVVLATNERAIMSLTPTQPDYC